MSVLAQQPVAFEELEDAESCCGTPRAAGDGGESTPFFASCGPAWACEPLGVEAVPGPCTTTPWQPQPCTIATQNGSPSLTDAGSEATEQQMGDDFEALDASVLLEDDGIALGYPGGVDAALADWQAAVSSHAHSSPATGAIGDAGGCSSCSCAHKPEQQQQPQQRAAPWWQPQPSPQQQPWAAGDTRAGHRPAPHHHHSSLPSRLAVGLPPAAAAAAAAAAAEAEAAAAAAAAAAVAGCRGDAAAAAAQAAGWLPAAATGCPWVGGEGDVVGDVLSGRLPAPSCNSCEDWLPLPPLLGP